MTQAHPSPVCTLTFLPGTFTVGQQVAESLASTAILSSPSALMQLLLTILVYLCCPFPILSVGTWHQLPVAGFWYRQLPSPQAVLPHCQVHGNYPIHSGLRFQHGAESTYFLTNCSVNKKYFLKIKMAKLKRKTMA